jgi:hypothetical protein
MKRSKMIPLGLALVSILGFYGVAFCGGEPGFGTCPAVLPAPSHGQFLYGTFTAALDQATVYADDSHFNVEIVLLHGTKVHLFSFWTDLGGGDLCDQTAVNPTTIKYFLAFYPCSLAVGEPFGFDPTMFTPVISDINILKRDFCGDYERQMIEGFIAIRLVPAR